MGDFKKLQVWVDAKNLAVHIYSISKEGAMSRDFGLRDQIRRSAVSIASNIAEGEESGRSKKSINYFYISRGSLAELETQVLIAQSINYLTENESIDLLEKIDILSRRLRRLIQFREKDIIG